MGRLGAVLGQFSVVGAMKSPVGVVSAREGPEMRYGAWAAAGRLLVVLVCFLLLCKLSIQRPARLALFLPRAGAFMWVYVVVSAGATG